MAKSKSDNTQPADKKRKAPKTAWKKGQSGNPKGAPKRGESFTEIIKRVGNETPSEAAAVSLELAQKFLSIGDGVTLKEAVIRRVYGSLLFDPQPGLLNAFMDRAEGKLKDEIAVNTSGQVKIVIEYGSDDNG